MWGKDIRAKTYKTGGQVLMIPVEEIRPNPDQPRREFDQGKLLELAQSIGENGMKANRENSLANLQQLKRLIAEDVSSLASKAAIITDYLQKMKDFYQCFSRTELVAGQPEIQGTVAELAAAYSNMLSLFWKSAAQKNFEYSVNVKASIYRKLTSIEEKEKIFYEYMGELVR